MRDRVVSIPLTEWERDVVSAIRDVPEGQPRELLVEVLNKLIEVVRDPHCAELQADGAPCATPAGDCEQCLKLKEILASLRRDLHG
ncbi:MAG: hypothetical protein ACOY3Y_19050 [Acidobacteriota bacterium]